MNNELIRWRYAIEKNAQALRQRCRQYTLTDLVCLSYKGTLLGSQQPLHLCYLGRRRFAQDILCFLTPQSRSEKHVIAQRTHHIGSFMLARATLRATAQHDADITVIDRTLGVFPRQQVFTPQLTAMLPVSEHFDVQARRAAKSVRSDWTKAKKQAFNVRQTRSRHDFDHFYNAMYVPFTQRRFGQQAFILPHMSMWRILQKYGQLLLVEENDRPVCGGIIYRTPWQPDVLINWKIGMADYEHLSEHEYGLRNAFYEVAVLEHARQSHDRALDFGLTRNVACDGVLTRKRRLGCSFVPAANTPEFDLIFKDACRAKILQQCPVYATTSAGMVCLAGQHGLLPTPALLRARLKSLIFPTLRGFDLTVSSPNPKQVVPSYFQEMSQGLVVPMTWHSSGA